MKALTICQPYADLIVRGRKTCENRTWETKHRGRLYIHAGKAKSLLDVKAGIDQLSGLRVCQMAFGAVVGVAELVACVHIESKLLPGWTAAMSEEQRHHVNGPWCWILKNVQSIGPWPYRGAQGLFEISEHEIERISNEVLRNG